MTRRLVIILTALWAAGCVSSQYMAVGDKKYPSRPPGHIIDVYVPAETPIETSQCVALARPKSQVPAGSEKIGRVDCEGNAYADWSGVLSDAQARARALGGDALVIEHWGTPMRGVYQPDQHSAGVPMYGKALSMTVLRYKD